MESNGKKSGEEFQRELLKRASSVNDGFDLAALFRVRAEEAKKMVEAGIKKMEIPEVPRPRDAEPTYEQLLKIFEKDLVNVVMLEKYYENVYKNLIKAGDDYHDDSFPFGNNLDDLREFKDENVHWAGPDPDGENIPGSHLIGIRRQYAGDTVSEISSVHDCLERDGNLLVLLMPSPLSEPWAAIYLMEAVTTLCKGDEFNKMERLAKLSNSEEKAFVMRMIYRTITKINVAQKLSKGVFLKKVSEFLLQNNMRHPLTELLQGGRGNRKLAEKMTWLLAGEVAFKKRVINGAEREYVSMVALDIYTVCAAVLRARKSGGNWQDYAVEQFMRFYGKKR